MRRRPGVDGNGTKAPAPTVNAKSEKIRHPLSIWNEAWKTSCRCIVPVSAFYEWTWPGGQMLVHRLNMDGLPFGIAGLWEDDPKFGNCFTLLTTIPNK